MCDSSTSHNDFAIRREGRGNYKAQQDVNCICLLYKGRMFEELLGTTSLFSFIYNSLAKRENGNE